MVISTETDNAFKLWTFNKRISIKEYQNGSERCLIRVILFLRTLTTLPSTKTSLERKTLQSVPMINKNLLVIGLHRSL